MSGILTSVEDLQRRCDALGDDLVELTLPLLAAAHALHHPRHPLTPVRGSKVQDPSSAHLDGYCDSPTEPYMVSLKQGRQLKELREGPENSLQLAV